MSVESPHCDADLLDLLRITGPLRVPEMAHALEVTPTAVRQRLVRLLGRGVIEREAIRTGRGRPRHKYWLTEKGVRLTGSNFTDLAVALWREVSSMSDETLRHDVLRRVAHALASGYAQQVRGATPSERMHSLAELLGERRIPATVQEHPTQPMLTTHVCPYPKLAEQDPSICAMEREMFSSLLGSEVSLTQRNAPGAGGCQFQAK